MRCGSRHFGPDVDPLISLSKYFSGPSFRVRIVEAAIREWHLKKVLASDVENLVSGFDIDEIRDAKDALMDWSCCLCRSSSEMVTAKATP
ncbi:hypothetical protein ACFX1R_045091 [Malus domestica]